MDPGKCRGWVDKRRAHILIGHYEIIYKLVRVVLSSVFHLYKGMGLFLFPVPGNKDFTSTRKYITEKDYSLDLAKFLESYKLYKCYAILDRDATQEF